MLLRRRQERTAPRRTTSAQPDTSALSGWRKRLFIATAQITADAADYFHLPRDRTVIMGSRIEV